MAINMLEPRHIERGLLKLKENNIKDSEEESINPLANMMKLISGQSSNNNSKQKNKPIKPSYEDPPHYSDNSEISSLDEDLINAMRERSLNVTHR